MSLEEGKGYLAELNIRKLLCKILNYLGKKYTIHSIKEKLDNTHFETYKMSILKIFELSEYTKDIVDDEIKNMVNALIPSANGAKSVWDELPKYFLEDIYSCDKDIKHPKSGQVTQKSIPIVTVTTDENGMSIKMTTYEMKKVLTITIGHLSADEICDFYDFNAEQKAMLDELLSDEYSELWNEIVNSTGVIDIPGGTQMGSGGFVWPVAGPYSITSRFGKRVDPISGAIKTHGGTDIAAAMGTPIVAAADGTVVISSYMANGYGYYGKSNTMIPTKQSMGIAQKVRQ